MEGDGIIGVDEVTFCALVCPNVTLKVNVFSPPSVFTGWRKTDA